jgi:hypothetical protein
MWQFTTIRRGQRAAVWNSAGEVRLVDGPRRLVTWTSTVEPVPQFMADPEQYLVVQFVDGRKEHVPGPASLWFDPTGHREIKVERALPIDANEAVVVYRQGPKGVERRTVRGPALFVPRAEEWLHRFSWHGADPKDHKRKIPRALQFIKLRVIPDQMYFDVDEVRTADDALVVVKVMIFFELTDIERMLDLTHDPIADFINALTADVIDFAAGLTFDQFKEQTGRLNDLSTYSQLASRAERIGYRINKVVYRGYHASAALQEMHDGAIEARTRLRLEAETERQAQELADLKQARERMRSVERHKMEEEEIEHQVRLREVEHQESLRRQGAAAEAELEIRRRAQDAALAHRQELHRERLAYLAGMKGMEIDLTRYLVAREMHPEKLITIDGGRDARLHVHEN